MTNVGWGPYHTLETTARRLGISEEEVKDRAANTELIMVETTDHVLCCPVWQFLDNDVHPAISQLLEPFKTNVRGIRIHHDPWKLVQLFTSGSPSLVQLAVEGNTEALDMAIETAKHYAWRWGQ